MKPVLTYFDATYVTGTYRAIRRVTTVQTPRRLHFRRCPPLVPIQTWNVFDALLNNQARTWPSITMATDRRDAEGRCYGHDGH